MWTWLFLEDETVDVGLDKGFDGVKDRLNSRAVTSKTEARHAAMDATDRHKQSFASTTGAMHINS